MSLRWENNAACWTSIKIREISSLIVAATILASSCGISTCMAFLPSTLQAPRTTHSVRDHSFTFLEASPSSQQGSSTFSVTSCLDREEAQALLESPGFLPSEEYGDRIVFGRRAAEKEHSEGDDDDNDDKEEEIGIMMSDDPRLARTYAEFPLSSLDCLLDTAITYLPEKAGTDPIRMVDIGSGLGRIVIYCALTRGWEIRGIEISASLHSKALEVVQTGVDKGIFEKNESVDPHQVEERRTPVSFHCGSATNNHGKGLLNDADVVFAYSTAFKAKGFDPDVGALILDTEEWSLPLSEACPDGCVVVTTDRALNPHLGWRVVDRIDVPNPEVLGSTGFVHVLEKQQRNQ